MENLVTLIYEFIATFVILVGIYYAGKDLGINTFIGIGALIAAASIIGAHVNPAVTGMFMITNKVPVTSIYTRILPQFAAMLAAAWTITKLNN